MPQIVDISPDHPIVIVTVLGSITDPESFALIARALQKQRESGIGDVLIDCEAMTHAMTNTQIVEMAAYVAGLDLPAGYRQAIIRPHDVYTAMAIDLWEAALNNRGVPVKVFRTRQDAVDWLLSAP